MKQTIYVDVLVSINLIVDYFLLYAAAVISGRKRDRVRMCIAAAIGAAGSLVIFLPRLPSAAGIGIAVLMSALMTVTAFGWRGWRAFCHSLIVMYALTAAYSGLMLLMWNVTGGGNISVNNGAVYINIDPRLLIMVTIILYAAMSFFSGRIRARGLSRRRCTVTLTGENGQISVEGLIDTGNMLTEPFSGMPVLVACRSTVAAVLPEGIEDAVENSAAAVGRRIRLIPYHTASGSGLMVAYRPKRIDIEIDGRRVDNISAYLALADNDRGMTNAVIINPDAIGR